MKSYKDFDTSIIGASDYCSLVLVGCKKGIGVVPEILHFGEDGCYMAYIVKGEAEIGKHYEKVTEYSTWMKVYDDTELAREFQASKIIVYRAGERGCIIQLLD